MTATHPAPTGDPDALSVRLRTETSAIHREAEQQPFMRTFFAARLSRDAYILWLSRQRHIYRALEDALVGCSFHPAIAGVVPPELHRSAAIESDLQHLTGTAGPSGEELSPATQSYVERITSAAREFPPGLLAHAWLRYLGNVGARDVLRRLTVAAIGEETGGPGLAFTDYSAIGDVGQFFRTFHTAVDAAPLTGAEKQRVVDEGTVGFRLNIALTDELATDLDLNPTPG